MDSRTGAIANALPLTVSPLAGAGADPAGGHGGDHAGVQAGSAPTVGGGHFHGPQDERPLHDVIIRAARGAGLAGVEVICGLAGYRCSRHVHESWRGFSYGLPVVVETIDREENIDAFAPTVQQLRQGATVIRQRLQVLQP